MSSFEINLEKCPFSNFYNSYILYIKIYLVVTYIIKVQANPRFPVQTHTHTHTANDKM